MYESVFDYLDKSIATLALIHNDCVKASCSSCTNSFKKDNNCIYHNYDKGDNEPVYYSSELDMEYHSCPLSMIDKVITDLYDERHFNKEFNLQLSQKEVSILLWWFMNKYDYYDNTIQSYKFKQEQKKNKKR